MEKSKPPLRIVLLSATKPAVEAAVRKGWWKWRRTVWKEYGLVYDPHMVTFLQGNPVPGGHRRAVFSSFEEALAWVEAESEKQQYPRVIYELPPDGEI